MIKKVDGIKLLLLLLLIITLYELNGDLFLVYRQL